jgi:hypothetical protein
MIPAASRLGLYQKEAEGKERSQVLAPFECRPRNARRGGAKSHFGDIDGDVDSLIREERSPVEDCSIFVPQPKITVTEKCDV